MAANKKTVPPVTDKKTTVAEKVEAPKTEVKKAEAAKVEAAKTETVKTETAKATEAAVKAEPAKTETVKAETAKTTAKKEGTTKASGRKAASKATPGKRSAGRPKKVDVKKSLHIQYSGKSYSTEELENIAKDVWKYDLKQKVGDLNSIELYVKPEENVVYYVMNKEFTGSFNI